MRANEASNDTYPADLRALPAILDKVDGWIAEGVLGGEQPNAADLQIAPSLRLLMSLGDLRPLIEARPAGELALRLFPDFPGDAPAGIDPGRDCLPRDRRLDQTASGSPARRTPSPSTGSRARQSLSRVPSGVREARSRAQQRDQDEAPLGHLRVRERERSLAVRRLAEQQDVDVDQPRAVADAALEVAAELRLDGLARVEQLLGTERVSIRRQALRNAGWSSTRPTGSVS